MEIISFCHFCGSFCFLSEWFCDQKMANELLDQYQELRRAIMDKIKIIAVTALKQEKVEVAQSLLEVTLHYGMRWKYTHMLREFFDYKCAQGDLKGCSAILTSTLELNVSLKPQHTKFFALPLDSYRWKKQLFRTKQQEHVHKILKVPLSN